jgi:hypothetical protein
MENFLLIVFWIIVAFYLLRLGARYLLPWLLRRFVKKMTERMSGTIKKEGEVSVKYNPVESPRIDPNEGEYVDFEEIKDTDKKK